MHFAFFTHEFVRGFLVAGAGRKTYCCLMPGRLLVGDATPTDPNGGGVLRSSLGRGRPLDDLSCIGAILLRNSWDPGRRCRTSGERCAG
ncbi:hypothetical protein EVAR_80504_1 [Eumeta japonica]|uniref:Uncharacterized protein n=1 Tax=Eumeta variegata TaxID=151549 RepID=A0A4C1TLE3_EUMVA|nr:hypothetical protein EVAR_80504_1 [Eumeta japonica]